MTSLILDNAAAVATMEGDDGGVLHDASIRIEDNRIVAVGPAARIGTDADRVIDARGHILIPGLVNTHHHFYQTLTRNLPAGQDAGLFNWLVSHYPVWARLDPEAMDVSTRIAAAELMLSGCTTAADHTYLWPNGARLDDQVQAAREMGLRFHAGRGSMSVGESDGGLPPDSVVESEAAILADSQRVIETHHDDADYAMTRVALAPCSPFSVSQTLMRESLEMARHYGVHCHTHLAETRDETAYCLERFGRTPVEYAEDLGWCGEDVWFAHMVHPEDDEVRRLGAHRCGVAHCPSSNMRLGSGAAPVRALRRAGARVGLGVDGSASNDGSDMLGEARQTMLLHRLVDGPDATGAVEALSLATRGGAAVLGRNDIGRLAPGMAADIVGYRLDTLPLAGGAVHDPLAALVFCRPPQVALSLINGRLRVRDGALTDVDLPALVRRHNDIARRIAAHA
ncbi:8-oxoguanine deaminase [Arhodomonas aquaeolei]|uniref:8-oxoguanine deaminase n=1 Tax=Arhodomonas aquaeolei TaxID=2369 RepID=UPI0021689EA2|nr:8-oxoguanine deaminase [Arhodomonas aquaeolei]MCS4503937.1 8-oxoguanine deaminase [Arhodomonas aquaeolei]